MTLGLLRSVAIVFVATTTTTAHADDLQLWTAAGASLFPVEQLEMMVEPQVRFDEDVSRVSAVLFHTGLRFRVVKWLRLGVGYRPEYERDGRGDFELRHRLNADGVVRTEIDPIRIGYRLRLQEQIRPSSRDRYRATLRNLLEVSYRGWKRWTPSLSAELFHALGDFDDVALERVRLTVGATYEIEKRQAIELLYRVELPQDDPAAEVRHIFGLTYHYDFHLQR